MVFPVPCELKSVHGMGNRMYSNQMNINSVELCNFVFHKVRNTCSLDDVTVSKFGVQIADKAVQ